MKISLSKIIHASVFTIGMVLLSSQGLAGSLNIEGTGRINGDLDMVNHQIKGVAYPVAAQDAASKGYVDDQLGGSTSAKARNPQRVALLRWYDINLAGMSVYPGTNTKPGPITFDGENIWVSCQGVNEVRVISAKDQSYIAFGSHVSVPKPGAIVFDGKNMWVASRGDGSIG